MRRKWQEGIEGTDFLVYNWSEIQKKVGKRTHMEHQVQENKMGVLPVNRLLISMALPIIISMLVQAFYNIVDSYFVAKLGESALTAVSLAFPIQTVMIAVGTGTGVGMNAMLSKSLGEKDQATADRAACNGVFLALCSAAVFMLVGVFCIYPFYASQVADYPDIMEYGVEYLTVACLFCQGIYVVGIGPFPRMGVTGAAVATVIGQFVAAIVAVIVNQAFNKEIHVRFKACFRPSRPTIRRIYSVGIPSIIMGSIGSVMYYGMNQILLGFTATASAVFGVYFKLQSFFFMPVFGMNNATVPIIAYNYGAQKRGRMLQTTRLAAVYCAGIMLLGLAVMNLFPVQLLGIFDASEQMLTIGVPALRIISLSLVFAGVCIALGSVFQALGNGVYSMIVSLTRQMLVLLPVAWLLARTGNLNAVWWAVPIGIRISIWLPRVRWRASRTSCTPCISMLLRMVTTCVSAQKELSSVVFPSLFPKAVLPKLLAMVKSTKRARKNGSRCANVWASVGCVGASATRTSRARCCCLVQPLPAHGPMTSSRDTANW